VEISKPNEATVLVARIDPVIAELLRRIGPSADPGDSKRARDRLFSPPTIDPAENHFSEDWQEYVEPELSRLFQSALEIIESDLKKMHADPVSGEATLSIPSDHLEAWIHGLNQARLVLTERHNLQEDDMDLEALPAGDPRAFLLLQLRIYAQLQWLFLRYLEGR
jgi:hypothetical protein